MAADPPETSAGTVCIRCGYDLRELPIGGPCPECGTPIEHSLGGDRLSRADPRWLARIALGQSLLAWGLLLAALGALSLMFVPIAFIAISMSGIGGGTVEALAEVAMLAMAGCVVIGLMICWMGAVLLTVQEPRQYERETRLSSRYLARWGMCGGIGALSLGLSVDFVPLTPLALTSIKIVLYLLATAAVTVAIVPTLNVLTGLAMRIPDEKLARRTRDSARTLRWAIPVFAVSQILTGLPAWSAPGGGPSALLVLRTGLGCAVLVIGIALIVQVVRLSGAMLAYRRAFRRCRDEAAAQAHEPEHAVENRDARHGIHHLPIERSDGTP